MNLQQRSDERSLELHRCIASKLRSDPALWELPLQNLARWQAQSAHLDAALQEWQWLLTHRTHEELLELITTRSDEAQRLRSSSPFTGILTSQERADIFARWR